MEIFLIHKMGTEWKVLFGRVHKRFSGISGGSLTINEIEYENDQCK